MCPSMSGPVSEWWGPHAREHGAFVLAAACSTASFWIFDLPNIVRVGPLTRRFTPATVSTVGLLAGLAVAVPGVETPEAGRQGPSRTGTLVSVLVAVGAALWVLGEHDEPVDQSVGHQRHRFQSGGHAGAGSGRCRALRRGPESLRCLLRAVGTAAVGTGPWLWMWYLIPHALNADLRLAPLFGQVFIASLLAIGAALEARRNRYLSAGVLAIVAFTFLRNPLFERFLLIGHTPVYWPLIALFAVTTSGRHYRTAADFSGAAARRADDDDRAGTDVRHPAVAQ